MQNRLFNFTDKLRNTSSSTNLQVELARIALIVLSEKAEGITSYDKKRVKKKVEDQKLNLDWGIDSFSHLEEAEIKELYENFVELEVNEIRKVFINLMSQVNHHSHFGLTADGFKSVLEHVDATKPIVMINADVMIEHYALVNKIPKAKLCFKLRSNLPVAHILFDQHIIKVNQPEIEDLVSKDMNYIHLGPFNTKPTEPNRNAKIKFHSTQEAEIATLVERCPKSQIIALLPISTSFNYQSREFRGLIKATDRIKSITEISTKALSFASIQTFILHVDSNKSEPTIEIKAKGKDSIKISKEKFNKHDEWSLLKYYSSGYKINKETISFESIIIDSFRGPLLKKSEDGEKLLIIQNKDLKENDIIDCAEIETEKYEFKGSLDRYYLQENDILLVCRGYNFSAAVIKNIQNKKILASSNILVIRPDLKKVDPLFIYLFLKSPLGKAELESRQVGTVQIVLSTKDVKSIHLPYLALQEQKEISKAFYLSKQKRDAEISRASHQYESHTQSLYSRMGIQAEN